MKSILNLKRLLTSYRIHSNKQLLSFTAFVLSLGVATILGSGSAHAATLTVATGNDTVAVDSSCSLSEAIENINDQAQTNADCLAGDGSNDTITIPAGTITLTDDLPQITEPVIIQGASMTSTIINGDSLYEGFNVLNSVNISNLKITAFRYKAIWAEASSIAISNVEVDGQDSVSKDDNLFGIRLIGPDSGGASTITIDSVSVHNISATNSYIHAIIIDLSGSSLADMTVSITNSSAYDLHAIKVAGPGFTQAGVNTIMMTAGLYQSTVGGSIDSTLDNITIDNITAGETAAGFGTFAMAMDGQALNLSTKIRSSTITDLHGSSSAYIDQSTSFFSAGAANNGGIATIVQEIESSLIADGTTDGNPTNCYTGDLSTNLGVSGGTVNTSIISNGHNISDDATCTSFTETGDQQNISNILPTLGPLQNNGGAVPTRALLAGSPAIASGSSVLGITTDARGVARASTCPSVGAYEYEGAVCGVATTNPGTSAGNGSLADTGTNTTLISLLGIVLTTLAVTLLRRRQAF